MNKYIATGVIALLNLVAPLAGAQDKVVSLHELAEEADFHALFQNGWDDSVIVKVPAGSWIPFDAVIEGDLIELWQEGEGRWMLEVKKTFYVRHLHDQGFLFSMDRKKWKPLFEFMTGQINAGLGCDEEGPLFNLHVTGNVRK